MIDIVWGSRSSIQVAVMIMSEIRTATTEKQELPE